MKLLDIDKYTYLKEEHYEYLNSLKKHASQSGFLPKHHIVPPCGLLNDPNGLSYFDNKYHVFYQWFPFGPSHGMKHWAHVVSEDLIDWKWDENMLIPDQEYEKNGCYSGNAIEKDGQLYLFYTANYKLLDSRIPKQALAVMDKTGKITKYQNNPVIDGAPEGITGDVRDPFVFEKNGRYYMLLGGKDVKDCGQILVYESHDLISFSYKGNLDLGIKELGTMFECPGYIEVDGQDVLFISSIGIDKERKRFNNQFTSLYFIGDLDLENLTFNVRHWDEVDCGFDFYAPQVFFGKDNTPMMFGWFGCGEQKLPTDRDMWRHGLTMPRKLCITGNRLFTEVMPGVSDAYGAPVLMTNETYHAASKTCRLTASLTKDESGDTLKIGSDDDYFTLALDWDNHTLTFDRTPLLYPVDPCYGMKRSCTFKKDSRIHLDIYIDNSFIEIYINHGERVLSGRTFISEAYHVTLTKSFP